MGAEQTDVEEEGLSLEKMSVHRMAAIHSVCTQSDCSTLLIKSDFHERNSDFLIKNSCRDDAICWKCALKGLSEDSV